MSTLNSLSLALLLSLSIGIIACKDPVTTSDQKNIQTNTNIVVFVNAVDTAGMVVVGNSKTFSVSVRDTNLSNGANITAATISGVDATMFRVTNLAALPIHLSPNGGGSIMVAFTPTRLGDAQAVLTLKTSTTAGNFSIIGQLAGTGYTAALCVDSSSLDFGTARFRIDSNATDTTLRLPMSIKKILRVTNCSKTPVYLWIDSLSAPGISTDNAEFSWDFEGGQQLWLLADSTLDLGVTFAPSRSGLRQATLSIKSPQVSQPMTVALRGQGL